MTNNIKSTISEDGTITITYNYTLPYSIQYITIPITIGPIKYGVLNNDTNGWCQMFQAQNNWRFTYDINEAFMVAQNMRIQKGLLPPLNCDVKEYKDEKANKAND